MDAFERNEITRLTEEYGGAWALNHSRRLLKLVESLASGEAYEQDAVWLAAHLHDWGAYRPWARPGVDHVARSLKVAGRFLAERGYAEELKANVLECIAHHHSRAASSGLRQETMLLHDADVLDLLGAVGMLREFSKNPRDLRSGYEAAVKRLQTLPATLFLERSSKLAEPRVQEMRTFLAAFEGGSFGFF